MRTWITITMARATLLFFLAGPASTLTIALDFGSLPSAQGWNYAGSATETSAFSADGTKLSQTTVGQGDATTTYRLFDALNPSLPFSLDARARVLESEQLDSGSFTLGFRIILGDGAHTRAFGFTDAAVRMPSA